MSNKQLFFWSVGLFCILFAINISGHTRLLMVILAVVAFICFGNRFLHVSLVLALPFAGVLQRDTQINQLSISFVLQGLLIIIFCLEVATKKTLLLKRRWLPLCALYPALIGINTFLQNRYSSIAWLSNFSLVGWMVGGLAIFHYVRTLREIRSILRLIVLTILCSYIIAFAQSVSGGIEIIPLEGRMGGGYDYIQGNMADLGRIHGPTLDSTMFGGFMWVGLLFSLFMMRIEKGRWKIILIVLLIVFVHGIYLSKSRQAVLAACIALLLYNLKEFWISRNKVWLLGSLVTIVIGYFVFAWTSLVFKGFALAEVSEKEIRIQFLPFYFNAFITNPLFGVGTGVFTRDISDFGFYSTEGLVNSTQFMLFAEQGVLGWASFSLLFINLWRRLTGVIHARVTKELKCVASLFLTLSIIYYILGFFVNNAYGTLFWATFFLGYRLIELASAMNLKRSLIPATSIVEQTNRALPQRGRNLKEATL